MGRRAHKETIDHDEKNGKRLQKGCKLMQQELPGKVKKNKTEEKKGTS